MMTMEQFEEEKTRLVALYGDTAREASGKRDQSLADLYIRSGWTQRSLAEIEKKSHGEIDRRLRFGRFLALAPIGSHEGLTERAFRSYWSQTNKEDDETTRFLAVQELMHRATTDQPAPKGLGKKIVAQFSDGKFHRLRDIAEALDVEMSAVRDLCDRIVSQGTFQTFGERRPAPSKDGSHAYRFVKGGKKKIDLAAFYAEAKPVLDDMENVINGHSVHFSQQAMKLAFAQFRQVIERVAR